MRRSRLVLVVTLLLAIVLPSCGDDGPRRVLLVGDSVMNQTGSALTGLVDGDVDVRNEGINGSGLLTPQFLDWPTQFARLVDRYDPDVVVFLFVGNYDLGTDVEYTTPDGHRIRDRRDPRFFRSWEAQAQLMTERAAEDAEVIWVQPPPMREPDAEAVVEGLREVYQSVVDEVGGTLLDADDVLADEDGGFLPEDDQGRPLRNLDGVHLANTGARRLAGLIADELG